MDIDKSGYIGFNEFKKTLYDFRVSDFTEAELVILFNSFDRKRDGRIRFKDLLRAVRGEPSDFRQDLVERVFRTLDKKGTGSLDLREMYMQYNPKKHPDAIQGKKSEDECFMEFRGTFEQHHLMYAGKEVARVTFDEFMEYYANVGVSIERDDNFQGVMNNAWNLTGTPVTMAALGRGQDEPAPSMYKYVDSRDLIAGDPTAIMSSPVRTHALMKGKTSLDNPLDTTSKYYDQALEQFENSPATKAREAQMEE